MIASKILHYEEDQEDFRRLLAFRYDTYIKELNYLAPTAEFNFLKMEFDRYDLYSEHIVLKDHSGIIACARIIKDSEFGLPILNKIRLEAGSPFFNQKNVEVSRLIVKKEYRSTRVFINLLQAVFESLLNMDCTCVLADTFVNSKSYKLLQALGFKKYGLEYNDAGFNVNATSTLLYVNMTEIVDSLTHHPNKGQMAFLKNISYKIAK